VKKQKRTLNGFSKVVPVFRLLNTQKLRRISENALNKIPTASTNQSFY